MFNRKKEPSYYQKEFARLQNQLNEAKPGTEEYDKILTDMGKLQELYGKQRITKEAKGNMATKIVGFLGLGALTFGLARFESKGNLFSGSAEKAISGIIKIGTRFVG